MGYVISLLLAFCMFSCTLGCLPFLWGGGGGGGGDKDPEPPPSTVSPEEIQAFLDAHNKHRAGESGTAMQKMRWNKSLQTFAEKVAAKCTMEHSKEAERKGLAGFDYVGENIYRSSPTKPTVQAVVDKWFNEKAFYTFSSASCKQGKMCGHYTQVVWDKSRDIGCGYALCDPDGDQWHYVVCNYGPGGNVGKPDGTMPTPYTAGGKTPGSACATAYTGEKADKDGLCV